MASSAYQTTLHIPSSSSTIPLPPGATETSSNSVSRLASTELRTATGKAKVKSKKTVTSKPSTIPLTESDKLFYTAETYIGPPKKKGRPKSIHKSWAPTDGNSVASCSGSDHHEDVIVIDGSDNSNEDAPSTPRSDDVRPSRIVQRHADQSGSSSKPSISQSKLKPKKKRPAPDPSIPPFSTAPLVRRPQEPHIFPTPSQPKAEPKAETQKDITLLDVLALLSATSPADPGSQNAAILAALNSIDSSRELNDHQIEEPNPALISALKQLLSICSKPLSSSEEFSGPLSSDQTPQAISSQEDEIVVLDKENVNPSVFRRRAQRDYEEAKLRGSSPPAVPSLGTPFATAGQAERQGPRLSSRSNENSPSKPTPTPSALSGGAPEVGRKRTLSDFLNEKDSGRNRSKARERERAERRDAHRHAKSHRQQTSANNSSRHYSRLVEQPRPEQSSTSYYRTGLEPWTSPPRPRLVESTEKMSDSWESEVETAQPHPFRTLASPKSHRISASSPVRSNSVHLQARKKYVIPAWARTSTATQPRLSEEARRAMQRAEQERKEKLDSKKKVASLNARQRTKTVVSKTNTKSCAAPTSEKSTSHVEPVTVAATSNYPLVAAAGILPLHSSFSSKHCQASSPPPDLPPFPKTPTREGRTNRVTSGGLADSLFTPISRSDSLFGSVRTPLFSPKTVFGTCPSPLSNRKVAKRSPSGFLKKQHLATPNAEQVLQGSNFLGKDNHDEVVLSWDLEGAFEELRCPPNSQPLTSSEVDVEEEAIAPANEYVSERKDPDTEDANDSDNVGVRQHWEGLPPSSPPPPTSPALMSQDLEDEEMEVLELPFPTSDIDADASSPDAEFAAISEDTPAFSEEEFAACLANGDFSAFFSDDQDLGKDISSDIDVFDQFTNLNAPSDQSEGKQAPIMNMDLEEMDFTEFWKTFKPLVEENVGMDFSSEVGDTRGMKTLDHTKLADDMQALLSGCLM
jgi:hypothetical protein